MANERFVELLEIPPELKADPEDKKSLAHAVSLMKDGKSFLAKVEHL